jgi:hypothetical protein
MAGTFYATRFIPAFTSALASCSNLQFDLRTSPALAARAPGPRTP